MALIGTLQDNFNDNSIDGTKWTGSLVGTGTAINETNQDLELVSGTSASNAANFYSIATYTLSGSQVSIKIVDTGTTSLTGYVFTPIKAYLDVSNFLDWQIRSDGKIYAHITLGGGSTDGWNATYVAATHKYLRIRELSGTCYWDYSADGLSWTNAYSSALGDISAYVFLGVVSLTTTSTTPTTAKVDDFNILPSAIGFMSTNKGVW